MKLYYFPPMTSIAPLIAAEELGLDLALERIDPEDWKTAAGAPFETVSAKRCMPVLELDDGSTLTETSVILTYIADLKPEGRLIAEPGTMARYRTYEWMSYFASEIHKFFTLLFWGIDDDAKSEIGDRIWQRFSLANDALAGADFLVDNCYSVADLYLFAVLRGLHLLDVDIKNYPRLFEFKTRMQERKAVGAALDRHI
ncbi:MAG: glutathione S-transferase family protein [Sphingomonadales bacterium]|nr:glutathione S-transferase family protein [Sphingomonadales bacterium]